MARFIEAIKAVKINKNENLLQNGWQDFAMA